MRIVRLLGWLLLALGIMAAGAEALYALEQGRLVWMPLGTLWQRLSPESLAWLKTAAEAVWSPLWDPGLVTVLRPPASASLIVLGALLLLVTRGERDEPRRRRRFSR
jgi:hypothetical protein